MITPSPGSESTAGLIQVRVGEVRQLLSRIDPSPVRDRDLDPGVEAFIVSWGREVPLNAELRLVVELGQPASEDEVAQLREAMHRYFENRAAVTRRSLRDLLRRGRTSLLIGVAVLGLVLTASRVIGRLLPPESTLAFLRESLVIGGWVAMWRPIEIFLYDWWPIRDEARLYDRLAEMQVEVRPAPEAMSVTSSPMPSTPLPPAV